MAIRTLGLKLGALGVGDPPAYASGWYRDPSTGQYYYYDAPGSRWYVYAAGGLYPLGWVPAPKTVEVARGDTLRIIASFCYVGPAFSGKLYGALGQKTLSAFDEILVGSAPLVIPETPVRSSFWGRYVDIAISSAVAAGSYSVYVKITDGVSLEPGKTLSDYLENAVRVVGVVPEFSDLAITDYQKV